MTTKPRNKPKPDEDTTDEDVVRVDEDAEAADRAVSTASPVGRHPRDTQFPSLAGERELEIAERTIDIDTANPEGEELVTSANHRKVFVLQAADWDGLDDEGKDAVHARNQRAVRQAMLSQGLRAPLETDVDFAGEKRIGTGRGGRSAGAESVALTYEVGATPVAVVRSVTDADPDDYELAHMVVSPAPDTGSALEQDAWENGAEARVRGSHAVKSGRSAAVKIGE